MAVTCTETIAPAQAISFGEATGEGVQREANSEDSAPAAQERMPPSMSLALVYVLIVLLVLNTEIVVPTADDYAKRLGASESFSGLVIALTPFWQGILGVPLNYAMLRCGISIKSMIIIMAAGSVAGNVLYALAGLMQSKCTILISRAMIGICQCQLAGPIYIARSVGVKRRTKVMFVFSSLTGVALCGAPLIASLLEIFVKELRIGDLLLNSDTMPGWFMAVVYFIYMLLIVFCFEDSSRDETSLSPNLLEEGESCWKPGLWVCLFASFLSTTTKTMCVVFFVKLSEQTWGLSISSTGFALAGAMALVTAGSFANSAVTTYVEDRRGLLIGCLCAAISAVLTFHFGDSWNTTSTIIFMLGFLPDLTLQEVLDLQAELYDGFSEPEFQEALRELEAIHGKAYRNYTDDHTKLFLTVQNKVLPRYGFDKGQAGVLQMLSVGARYNDNEEFCSNRALLNELIGMAPAIGEQVELKEKKALPPRPYSQQLLITESLRWAPSLTTRHWQPQQSHLDEAAARFQLAEDVDFKQPDPSGM